MNEEIKSTILHCMRSIFSLHSMKIKVTYISFEKKRKKKKIAGIDSKAASYVCAQKFEVLSQTD